MARIVDSRVLIEMLHNVGLSQIALAAKGMITGLDNQQHESLMIALARFYQVEGHKAVEDEIRKKMLKFRPSGSENFHKTRETVTPEGSNVHKRELTSVIVISKQDIDWLMEK